ncbi:glycosyltransferase family 2 protein [Undibacterium sp. RTI2.1]|uniref:glycosyltransferase family 2 protein n=1 Tax=unclassified Undibacterium TaxID=2630295 RepID=UPI002B23C491|nr:MULTISPECIES: glycosyltransferase family 2 protein [unclassified Undibacterium]MEB0032617.1 glycosyltransferase family 2 protein [Undibacterium sp. RTI2.1]MEB0118492.1 glycosyltransferase family 2 protein [Undibacterium sp. RTI2.2]
MQDIPIPRDPKVTVIIVNWNGGDLLLRCLTDLLAQTYAPHEVIVIDNASTDGSGQAAAKQFSQIRVVDAGSNLGFAAGNNLAVSLASKESTWIALINPDAFPESDWLKALVDAAVSNPQFAIFGSRLMDANSPSLLDGIGDIYHMSGLPWREAHGQVLKASMLAQKEIFSTCAAAGLYRRDIFEEIGGFDEDYFCYLEDVDLGFRYQLLGHRCLYVPDSVANHVGSALTGKRSDFSIYHGHRNLVWTFVKNMPGVLFWPLLPLHLLLNLTSIIYFAAQGKGKVIYKAKFDAIKGLPDVWRKRKLIQAHRHTSIARLWGLINKNVTGNRK